MAMDEKIVNIVMKMLLDPADFSKFKAGLMNVDEQIAKMTPAIERANAAYDKQSKRIEEVKKQMNGLREQAEKLQTIGMAIAAPSVAVLGGLTLAAKKYVESQKDTEKTSKRILELQKQGEEITIRIGRIVASEALPFLEKAAQLAEKVAAFAEKHPEIIAAALKISAAGVVAGGAIGLAGQGMRLAGTVGGLAAENIAGGSAAAAARTAAGGAVGAGALPAGVAIGALAIGGMIGKGIGDYINKALGQESADNPLTTVAKATMLPSRLLAKTLQETSGFAGDAARGLIGVQDAIIGFVSGTDNAAPTIDKAKKSEAELLKAREDLALLNERELALARDLFLANDALFRAEFEAAEKRKEMVDKAAEDISKLEQESANKRFDIIKKSIDEERKAEHDYNLERMKTARDGGIEISRIEEDSQRRIAQMRREFESQAADFTRARDALGLIKAKRDFEDKVKDERSNTDMEINRRREDIALRLADMDAAYQYEAQQRQAALTQALNEQQASENAQIELARANQAQQLAELDAFYKAQLEALNNAIIAARLASGYYNNDGIMHAKAGGGYAEYGRYILGDKPGGGRGGREFVMTAATTRAAEQIVGGRLSQESLLNTMTMNIQMPQGGTLSQVRQMMAENNQMLLGQIGQAFGAL